MLLPTDKADHFVRAYKEMLSAAAGRPLNTVRDYAKVRDMFFESEELRKNPPTQDSDLIEALETASFGRFVIARHMARWTEMIGTDNRVYRVIGLTTEIRDVTPQWVIVQTAVMEFMGEWICDGLVAGANVAIGPGMHRRMLDTIRQSAPKKRMRS